LTTPTFIVARAVKQERSRATGTNTGDEISLVNEKIAGALALSESGIQKRQR